MKKMISVLALSCAIFSMDSVNAMSTRATCNPNEDFSFAASERLMSSVKSSISSMKNNGGHVSNLRKHGKRMSCIVKNSKGISWVRFNKFGEKLAGKKSVGKKRLAIQFVEIPNASTKNLRTWLYDHRCELAIGGALLLTGVFALPYMCGCGAVAASTVTMTGMCTGAGCAATGTALVPFAGAATATGTALVPFTGTAAVTSDGLLSTVPLLEGHRPLLLGTGANLRHWNRFQSIVMHGGYYAYKGIKWIFGK